MAMYATGNGVIPMPFQKQIEAAVGRTAISTMDYAEAKKTLAKRAAEGAAAAP